MYASSPGTIADGRRGLTDDHLHVAHPIDDGPLDGRRDRAGRDAVGGDDSECYQCASAIIITAAAC